MARNWSNSKPDRTSFKGSVLSWNEAMYSEEKQLCWRLCSVTLKHSRVTALNLDYRNFFTSILVERYKKQIKDNVVGCGGGEKEGVSVL